MNSTTEHQIVPYYVGNGVTLYQGGCLPVLKAMPDASVDSVCTDPPYGIKFMGKRWDSEVPPVEVWEECLRVLKPGGHLLSFGGTRTYHRIAVAIEDAGFEIRDMIAWVYGTGFPKSMDISKAIDLAGGMSPREQSEMLRSKREASGMSREDVAANVGCTPSSVRDWEEGRARAKGAPIEFIVPSREYRSKIANLFGYSEDERRLVGASTDRRGDGTVYGIGHSGEIREGGFSINAQRFKGWGTALKPAMEPIAVARKPLIGTVAENVIEHGTGGFNVDSCRIATTDRLGGGNNSASVDRTGKHEGWKRPWMEDDEAAVRAAERSRESTARSEALGRWPANLIHDGDDEVLELFPIAGGGDRRGKCDGKPCSMTYNDSGSAARFFYCAKPTKKERGEYNNHPTVKPIALMDYLCRLVTPPGGVILDPYAGTLTTGIAAMKNGFRFIGIEMYAEHCEIGVRRLGDHLGKVAS